MSRKRILIPAVSLFTLACLGWFALDYFFNRSQNAPSDSDRRLADYCGTLKAGRTWSSDDVPDKSWKISRDKPVLDGAVRIDASFAHCEILLQADGSTVDKAVFFPD